MADSSGGLFKEDPVRSLARRKISLLSIAFLLFMYDPIFLCLLYLMILNDVPTSY
jgi:hypothetical protein